MARGDHIYVERVGGLYAHHGIDCGDGTVIHYTGPDPMRCRVRRSAIEEFRSAGAVRRLDLPPPESSGGGDLPAHVFARLADYVAGRDLTGNLDRSPDAIVARAESRIGEGGFDPVFNNCEHFATWCRTGISRSSQVEALCWPVPMLLETIGAKGLAHPFA